MRVTVGPVEEVTAWTTMVGPPLLVSDGRVMVAISTPSFTTSLATLMVKTNCPVTDQPDWASIYIDYQGPKIDRDGLLKYLVSYRQHQDFHEQCVEQIFSDILSTTIF